MQPPDAAAKLDPSKGPHGDAPKTWPRADAGGGGAQARKPAAFDAPGEGKGNSALSEVRAANPGLDPRWPPVKPPGGGPAVVVESGAPSGDAPGGGSDAITEEEVKKHNKPNDCWARALRASCSRTVAS